ncbi:hypothetical protein FI667_g1893, partial [Globisporangium splendens]
MHHLSSALPHTHTHTHRITLLSSSVNTHKTQTLRRNTQTNSNKHFASASQQSQHDTAKQPRKTKKNANQSRKQQGEDETTNTATTAKRRSPHGKAPGWQQNEEQAKEEHEWAPSLVLATAAAATACACADSSSETQAQKTHTHTERDFQAEEAINKHFARASQQSQHDTAKQPRKTKKNANQSRKQQGEDETTNTATTAKRRSPHGKAPGWQQNEEQAKEEHEWAPSLVLATAAAATACACADSSSETQAQKTHTHTQTSKPKKPSCHEKTPTPENAPLSSALPHTPHRITLLSSSVNTHKTQTLRRNTQTNSNKHFARASQQSQHDTAKQPRKTKKNANQSRKQQGEDETTNTATTAKRRSPHGKRTVWLLDIKLSISTRAHLDFDGQTERVNRALDDVLRSYATSFKEWSEFLPLAEFALNNSTHVSTGHSPFYVNYGIHPRVPASIMGEVSTLSGGGTPAHGNKPKSSYDLNAASELKANFDSMKPLDDLTSREEQQVDDFIVRRQAVVSVQLGKLEASAKVHWTVQGSEMQW